MIDSPRIRIELEGLSYHVNSMFSQHNDALSKEVAKTLQRELTEDWVKSEIEKQVQSCIKSAVADLTNDYRLKSALTGFIVDQLESTISGGIDEQK